MIPDRLTAAQALIKSVSKKDFKEKILPIVRTQAFINLASGKPEKTDHKTFCDMLIAANLDNLDCNRAAVHWYVRAITARIVCEHWHT